MNTANLKGNVDPRTVDGFGREWRALDQAALSDVELEEMFLQYFRVFPWHTLPEHACGFDVGCGSGRWARLVAPRAGRLVCIDPSPEALAIAKRNLTGFPNCQFHLASVDQLPLEDSSMDFGYALGVLHHVPDPEAGLASCVRKLKPGAPFLLYLYSAFDNRPGWYVWLWRVSNMLRKVISALPFFLRYGITQLIAACVYYPLARVALLSEELGADVRSFPLSAYRRRSFYTMRTDALDRFATRLEQRFTAGEIRRMMEQAGLERIVFSDSVPYWCVIGFRANSACGVTVSPAS